MSAQDLQSRVTEAYQTRFDAQPDVVTSAPGRVNLLGEHTDYNGGFVLPMALSLGVGIAMGLGPIPGRIVIYSDTFHDEETRLITDDASGKWSDYVLGCLKDIVPEEIAETGLRIALITTLPLGAGLSSSAALEVATLRAATAFFEKPMSDEEIAIAARKCENDFVGMPCGIMDQFASSVGNPGEALFLNTRTLEHRPTPLPEGHSFVIVHSGVSHQLTEDGYATRVAECNAACALLGVEMLSDLSESDMDRIVAIVDPMNRRARHIVTENQRVTDAIGVLQGGDAAGFGALMLSSHVSQRDDYDVSVPEVDALVDGAMDAGALGARLTGGGFGGSIVALVRNDQVEAWCATIAKRFPNTRVLAIT